MVLVSCNDESVDITSLALAISAAEANENSVRVSLDGEDVEQVEEWVEAAVMNGYKAAIAVAKEVRDNSDATQAEVGEALEALAAATTLFNSAKQYGTKPPVYNNNQSKGYETIQAAISEADDGDTIVVQPASYDLIGEGNTALEIDKEITLRGVGDVNILGNFKITAANVTLEGFSIKKKLELPAIYIAAVTDTLIKNNKIDGDDKDGGSGKNSGIQLANITGTVSILNNEIFNNKGNGIWVDIKENGDLVLTGNTIKNNLTGVNFNSHALGSTTTIEDNEFIENRSHGISIGTGSGGIFSVKNNTFDGNVKSQFSDRRYTNAEDVTVSPSRDDIVDDNTFVQEVEWRWDAGGQRYLLETDSDD